jgi:hypothetical protein
MSISKPTDRWRELIGEDDAFTEEAVSETERILDSFQQRLSGGGKIQEAILMEVKRVIVELNELDHVREDPSDVGVSRFNMDFGTR